VTRRAAPPRWHQSLAKRAVCSIVHFQMLLPAHQTHLPGGGQVCGQAGDLALTFSTLLSSQGAGAHRDEPFGVRGATYGTLRGRFRGVKPGMSRSAAPPAAPISSSKRSRTRRLRLTQTGFAPTP